MLFQGHNAPKRSDIFGPSGTGGVINDTRDRQLYQHGEGIGSIFSSIFRKILPAAAQTMKNIAGSKIVRHTGKQLLDSTITGLTNAAADAIAGDKTVKESVSDELKIARNEISTALKKANKNRKSEDLVDVYAQAPKKRKKPRKKASVRYKRKRHSVFDEDD